ncbi:hypothetical protein A1O7_05144 [Cladophialophora yegresii CBS 114405]|uniref:Uncharacterized protein n=1 Tax=Cladophialophora yegresii CBS 114405 TaxID=1182544 RepID=W9W8Y0_9EURO|nr:uncharacterized protein A1O7_05144 [Cladophialophora yegresii CBS 114405]EXJ60991.1 hypothetical protein A1O7_05144 [Cladophialophora yegresii CBS 114405]
MSAEAPFPVRTTMVAEQESPTFTFGEPPSSHESAVGSAAPIQVEARMKADPEAVMYTSCGRYPPPARPTKAGRKPDYDHATMEDFRRHLGVIDCRNVPAETSSNPSRQMPADVPQTQNHALQDYETQLMLLEQAKRERDLSFKQEFEQRGCYSSSPQPNHISATGKQARWQDQRQLMMMEQQKELLQATQGLEANAQRARIPCNVPVGSRTEYQLQLILLEQQNQFRLMQARMAEEDAKNAEERRLAREQRILDRLAEQARCHPPPPGTF